MDATACPRCGQAAGIIWVHGHGQCAACHSNIQDCCQGSDCDLAPANAAAAPREMSLRDAVRVYCFCLVFLLTYL